MIYNCQQRSNLPKNKFSPKKRLVQVASKNSTRQTISPIGRSIPDNKKKASSSTSNHTYCETQPEFYRSTISNFNSENNQNVNPNINSYPSHFDISDLVFKENDDYKTIVNKNSKLRNLIIKASQKLNDMNQEHLEKEKDFEFEKATILKELDTISSNYKLYAESYKNYSILDEQYRNLQKDYNHNYNLFMCYQDNTSYLIKDFIILYKLINSFSNGQINKSPVDFLYELKETIFNKLKNYKHLVDIFNFRDIYEEYCSIFKTHSTVSFTNNNFSPTSDSFSKTILNERPVENIANNDENYSKKQVIIDEKPQEEDQKINNVENKNELDLISKASKIKIQQKLKIQLRNSPMFKPREEREVMSDPKRQSKSPLKNYMNSTLASLKHAINKSSSNRNLSENKTGYNSDDENQKSKTRNSSTSRIKTKNLNLRKNLIAENRPIKGCQDINEFFKIDKKIFNFKNKVYKPTSPNKKGLRNEKHQMNGPGTSSTARTNVCYDSCQ